MTFEDKKGVESFSEFIGSIQSAKPEQYVSNKKAKFATEDTFSEMKNYLLEYYKGVEVTHSFVDENGVVFDCIPIEKQQVIRPLGKSVSKAPDLPEIKDKTDSKDNKSNPYREASEQSKTKDKFGNEIVCPSGTIPIRRITLNELTRFESLRQFFQKSPVGAGRHSKVEGLTESKAAATHKYAYSYQNVESLGGHSFFKYLGPSSRHI